MSPSENKSSKPQSQSRVEKYKIPKNSKRIDPKKSLSPVVVVSSPTSVSTSTSTSQSTLSASTSKNFLSKSQIWNRIQRRVISYLRESREDEHGRSPSEKTLHALLLSTGGQGDADGHKIEMYILVNLLELIERRHADSNQYKPKRDERPHLLKLVVWCLHSWKTMSRTSSKERKSFINLFESCFFKTLGQIRMESAISTKVEASTKCLGLLGLMKKIQKGWVGLQVSTPALGENVVDSMEETVFKHVEEKMKLPTGNKEELLFIRHFETLKKRLEYVCNGDTNTTAGSKAIQGMLMKELVQVFCDSVEKDMAHRDHTFIFELISKTNNSSPDYKRCLIWVMMKLLPILKEKFCGATRLINTAQGLFRHIITRADSPREKEEVAIWNQILKSTLSQDDLTTFYSIVMTKRFMNRFPPTDKVFEDFFPVRRNEELSCIEKETIKQTCETIVCKISTLDEEPESSDPWEIKGTVDWDMVT